MLLLRVWIASQLRLNPRRSTRARLRDSDDVDSGGDDDDDDDTGASEGKQISIHVYRVVSDTTLHSLATCLSFTDDLAHTLELLTSLCHICLHSPH